MSQYIPTYDSLMSDRGERYIPTDRFQVLSSVYLPSSDVDPQTGMLKPDRQRRCRTQGKRMEIERLNEEESKLKNELVREMGKGGRRVSMRLGLLVITAIVVICGFLTLAQLGTIAQRQKDINRIERSAAEYARQNDDLEAAIADASDFAKVCFVAAQELNMIPASTAEAIHLVAADSRPMERRQLAPVQQETLQVDVTENRANVTASASNSN